MTSPEPEIVPSVEHNNLPREHSRLRKIVTAFFKIVPIAAGFGDLGYIRAATAGEAVFTPKIAVGILAIGFLSYIGSYFLERKRR